MKVLISPNEPVATGYRVVQLCDAGFDVADPLFWVDCPVDLDITAVCYDPVLQDFRALPEPTPEPAAVPQIVTMRQARLALLQSDILTQVNTAIANMPGAQGDAARIEWEYAQEVHRDSPLLAELAAVLELTTMQLDELFTLAGGL